MTFFKPFKRMTDPTQQFASDNYSGICPEAWAAMAEANHGHERAYGEDQWTARAAWSMLNAHFGVDHPTRHHQEATMGLFNFIKEAGEKLFGGEAQAAAPADAAAANAKAGEAISKYLATLQLAPADLAVSFDGASSTVSTRRATRDAWSSSSTFAPQPSAVTRGSSPAAFTRSRSTEMRYSRKAPSGSRTPGTLTKGRSTHGATLAST